MVDLYKSSEKYKIYCFVLIITNLNTNILKLVLFTVYFVIVCFFMFYDGFDGIKLSILSSILTWFDINICFTSLTPVLAEISIIYIGAGFVFYFVPSLSGSSSRLKESVSTCSSVMARLSIPIVEVRVGCLLSPGYVEVSTRPVLCSVS